MKTEIRTITPEQAMEMLKINTRNRPLREHTVSEYARQMKAGLWKFNGESIIISDGNVLLDGQHRLAACVKSNTSITVVLVTGVSIDSFDTIDTGIVRTGADILAISGVKNSATVAAGITMYYSLVNSFVTIDTGITLRNIRLSKSEILSFYNKHSALCQDVALFSKKCNKKSATVLKTGRIMGLCLFLILEKKHDCEYVFDFFEQLTSGANITNSTILVLRDKLLRDRMKLQILSPRAKDFFIAKTWNAYVSGRTLSILRYSDNEGPIQYL